MIIIRPRKDDDFDALITILHRVYKTTGYPIEGIDKPKQYLTRGPTKEAWVAELDNRIIGHVTVRQGTEDNVSVALWHERHPEDYTSVLSKLFVDPDSRGQGVATKLIEHVLSWSRDETSRLLMFALIKDADAIRLYGRLGWSEYGRSSYHYGEGQQMEAVCFASPEMPT